MLTAEERRILIQLGIEKTNKVYKEAKDIAKLGYWNLTGNRLYYAAFHMASFSLDCMNYVNQVTMMTDLMQQKRK